MDLGATAGGSNARVQIAPHSLETRDERKILAAAISGFSNSSGGLVVWGVDARKDPDTKIDAACDARPVGDPDRLLSNLIRESGTAVSPLAARVSHRLVESRQFALTLVPESDEGPHMARVEHRYFKRAGDSFYPMEHYDLADMFGRRRRPVLRVELAKEGLGETVPVLVINNGRGLAKHLFVAIELPKNFKTIHLPQTAMRHFARDSHQSFLTADAGTVVHPGQSMVVTKLEATARQMNGMPILSGPQRFRFQIAAEDFPLALQEIVLQACGNAPRPNAAPRAHQAAARRRKRAAQGKR